MRLSIQTKNLKQSKNRVMIKISTTIKAFLLLVVFLLITACGNEEETTDISHTKLPEIPLSLNMDSYSLPVQNQINQRTHYISLIENKSQNQDKSKFGWAIGQLGKVYHAYVLMDEARDSYINAIFFEPDNFEWYYLLAHIYKDLGQLEESKDYFNKVLTFKEYIPAKVWLSDILLRINDYKKAEELCNEVLLIEDNHPRALYNLALIKQHYDENEEALLHLLNVQKKQPDAYQINYQIGQVYAKLGQLELAKKFNEKVVDDDDLRISLFFRDPLMQNVVGLRKDDLTFISRAKKATAHGNYKNAILILEKILKTNPDQVEALYKLAINYHKLNNNEKAKDYINKVIELDINYDKAYSLLATININEKKLDLAESNVNKALANNSLNVYYLNQSADVFYRQGNYTNAASQFIKSIEVQPGQELSLIHI